jgi:predicted ABC-type ATPase
VATLYVVAGVNGCGKSTLTAAQRFRTSEIIDPDSIAKTLTNRRDQAARLAAGRESIRLRQDYLSRNASFVLETTLSGKGALAFMQDAKNHDYRVELHYIFLMDEAQSMDRVKTRVANGGHSIPDADIRRRFDRSRANLPRGISLADRTLIYDNSGTEERFLLVCKIDAEVVLVEGAPQWIEDLLPC